MALRWSAMLFFTVPRAYGAALENVLSRLRSSQAFKDQVDAALPVFCKGTRDLRGCSSFVQEAMVCLEFAKHFEQMKAVEGAQNSVEHCRTIDSSVPDLNALSKILVAPGSHRSQAALLQQTSRVETWAHGANLRATRPLRQSRKQVALLQEAGPEDDLAKEMTHDLEMNFNKIAPFGKEDTARELQDHAAKTQDTLVDAVENAEVAEIKRAVFRALTRLRAATIKEFDTIARLETQAIDAYNDAHHYRAENPLAHFHEDEAPVETDKLKSFH